jgi:hypothetical protein
LDAAKREATRMLGQTTFSLLDDFWAVWVCTVSGYDERGLQLFELHALAVRSPAAIAS